MCAITMQTLYSTDKCNAATFGKNLSGGLQAAICQGRAVKPVSSAGGNKTPCQMAGRGNKGGHPFLTRFRKRAGLTGPGVESGD
jgi:hypothetical protein